MELNKSELHIWRYTVSEKEYLDEKSSPLLSPHEQSRCNAYLHEAEKIRYTGNHRVVRKILAQYLQAPAGKIVFDMARQGKPFIKNAGLFFSYTYRGNSGLLAVSRRGEVGVDIEKIKPLHDLAAFADFSFSAQEKKMIFESSEEQRDDTLFTFWTFKEAIIKCLGVGLNADLTQIDLSEFYYRDMNPLAFDNNTMYTIRRMNAEKGYRAAFAVKGEINDHSEFNYTTD